jgi:hypothetical protein
MARPHAVVACLFVHLVGVASIYEDQLSQFDWFQVCSRPEA